MKNIREIVNEISKREGLKSQVSIGDIREILSILSDLTVEHGYNEIHVTLLRNGERRKKRKK